MALSAAVDQRLLGRRFVVGSLTHLVVRALVLSAALVTAPILARHLGPLRFGTLTLILTASSLVSVLGDFGLPALAGRDLPALATSDRSEWTARFLSLRWRTAFLAAGASAVVAVLLLRGEMRTAFLAALAGGPAVLLSSAASAVFAASFDPGRSAVTEAVGRVAVVAATVVVAVDGGSITAILAAMSAAHWVGAGFSLVLVRQVGRPGPPARGDVGVWTPTVRRALPLAVIPVLGVVHARVDTLILAALAGDAELGLYGVMYRILEAALALVAVVGALLVPAIADAVESRQRSRRHRQGQWALVAMFLPIPITLAVFAEDVLRVLGGPAFLSVPRASSWGGPALALASLMAALAVMLVNTTNGAAMVALHRSDLLIRHFLVTIPTNVVLTVALATRWSYLGAALATLATELVAAVWSSSVVRRLLPGATVASNLGGVVGAGTAMVVVLLASGWLPVPLRIPLGGLAYAGVLLWSSRRRAGA